jgi:protein involved in sex pheromone biosynthesis
MIKKNEKRLSIDIPIDIYNSLKAISIAQNLTMKEWLTKELSNSFKKSRPVITWRENDRKISK